MLVALQARAPVRGWRRVAKALAPGWIRAVTGCSSVLREPTVVSGCSLEPTEPGAVLGTLREQLSPGSGECRAVRSSELAEGGQLVPGRGPLEQESIRELPGLARSPALPRRRKAWGVRCDSAKFCRRVGRPECAPREFPEQKADAKWFLAWWGRSRYPMWSG